MSEKLRFGIVGCGVIAATHLHLARDDQKEVGAYGITATASTANPQEKQGATAASNPAALSGTSHTLQIADMIRAIRENGTPIVDGYAARRPVEIILGIYESARAQQEVILS